MLEGKVFAELLEKKQFFSDRVKNIRFSGLNGSSFAFFLSEIFKKDPATVLVISSDKEKAAYLFNDLQALLDEKSILYYPESHRVPYQPEKTANANIQERAEVLSHLTRLSFKGIVVTYPAALYEKVTTKAELSSNTLQIRKGEKLSIDFIADFLNTYHFENVEFVFEPGQYSIRGGIIDIYSYANEYPFRIELFGDEVDTIKAFDPSTQLSNTKHEFITIIPNINRGQMAEHRSALTEYFPEGSLLCCEDLEFTSGSLQKFYDKASQAYESLAPGVRQLEPKVMYLDKDTFLGSLLRFSTIHYGVKSVAVEKEITFDESPQPSFQKNFELLINNLKENKARNYKNYFFTDNPKQADRLFTIFNDILAKEHRSAETLIDYVTLNIHEGFIDHEIKVACYTDHQVFERYHRFRLKETKQKTAQALTLKEILSLNPGDYVTHIDHGIGRFGGLEKLTVNGKTQEVVRLVYKDNDILYVSIHSLHRISKYSGKEANVPRIDKLGSTTWSTLKQKTKRKVKEVAYDLIKLYAQRKSQPGHAFPKDNYLQHELEASFIYEDTPDQVKVTRDVKRDMEKPHPMDRLVCGDVGFGKTEIAIRAAFKAVCDGKQVAIMVPTTILAYQHFKTFKERLKDFPCNVDYINRFRSTKEQKEIFEKISSGKLDIIIGTHRLVSKEVKFKDLGLLIIDEEQKFGVGVKDKLKLMRANVDTLTLTATPIPRTLQFSLMGARDLSVISTPPPNRYPVQTELHTFSEELIREAVSYELQRGGQVFFVHNRVNDLKDVAGVIQRVVPDARIAIGHGQMDGDKLEDVMLGFMEGSYDVLVSTTIIESGLDISNANTMIIDDAQNFGLSDLHQMRGRVGRSNKKAFCYLLAPPQVSLTDEARKRLRAIVDFSDLGSGFQIAMRDLDIRGAGNLLGAEQSGFINDMGFDTYMKILNEAMEELKEEKWYKETVEVSDIPEADKSVFSRQFVKETVIDTDLQLLIPDHYVSNLTERLILYRELDNTIKEEELIKYEENLRDRFGPLPAEALELINVVRLRWQAMKLGFEKLTLKNGKMISYFISQKDSSYFSSKLFFSILNFAQKNPNLCRLKEQNNKLWLTIEDVNSINSAREVLKQMEKLIEQNPSGA
jgi:transcription-repair coupling factor (superfamily II helicase)